jgi:hypothetical protein
VAPDSSAKLRMAHLRLSEYDSLLLGKIRF